MEKTNSIRGLSWLVMLAVAADILTVGSALGIVWHPEAEPNLVTWTDRPNDAVIGRWIKNGIQGNGSCVVVSPNYVITTKHQLGYEQSLVIIEGITYTIDWIEEHPEEEVDLRVVKLHSANLSDYVDMNDRRTEAGKNTVLGGYGKGRGEPLDYPVGSGNVYGYRWDGSGNTTLRWCTNKVNDTDSLYIYGDFDGLNEGDSTIYEGITAEYDSGGGWFIESGGFWKVAGLSRGVAHVGGEPIDSSSWFRKNTDPDVLYPDYLVAVRISSYANWIESVIDPVCDGPVVGDFNGDCSVDVFDFTEFAENWLRQDCGPDNNYCQGSDFEPDGDVDLDDFGVMAVHWLEYHLD